MEKIREQDKMEILPVKKLMLRMGIPMILSMVLQAVYNIVDSAFVSNMEDNGELALNALTLAFPLQMLIVAIGIGTGVGVNVLVAKSLGEGNRNYADKAAGNGVFLAVVIFAVFLIFGLFGVKLYIGTQTANGIVLEMACDYLRVCCVYSFGLVFFSLYEKLLQATGKSVFSTIAQICGAVANIILDPIMIYGLLGCPKFGVKGAAYATVIGQIISLAVAFIFHIKFNKDITNNVKNIKPSAKTILNIYKIGLPAIIAQALMSVMTYGFNLILGTVSEAMVTAYGLYYKIQQFILFAAFGLRDAITPIMSYAFGMKSKKRIDDSIKFGSIYTTVIMFVGLAVIEIIANPLSSAFGLSGETQLLCIGAMRIVSASFIFAGINIAFQGMFQAINGGMQSLIVSVCRQLVFVLPLAWIFTVLVNKSICGEWIIWLSVPVAEILSAVISVVLMKKLYQKQINNKTEA